MSQLTFEFKWRGHGDGEWHTQCRVSNGDKFISDRIFILLTAADNTSKVWNIEIFDNTVKDKSIVQEKQVIIPFKNAKRIGQKMAIQHWARSNMERLLAQATENGDLE